MLQNTIIDDYQAEYCIRARIGEMLLEGKHGLIKDCKEAYNKFISAAELAAENGKGKLADKYYYLAEKADEEQN